MKIENIHVGSFKNKPAFQRKVKTNNVSNFEENQNTKKEKLKKALPWIIVGGASAVGIGASYLAGVKSGKMSIEKAQNVTLTALLALAGYSGLKVSEMSKDDIDAKLNDIQSGNAPNQQNIHKQGEQIRTIRRTQTNSTVEKHAEYFNDLLLLKQDNVLNRNAQKYVRALDSIENAAAERLSEVKDIKPINKKHPTIWSVTSEFAPIKEGGLGSVPPEIRNNAEKLGVNMPTFLPMYLNDGQTSLYQNGENYEYIHKGKSIPLEKIATVKMDTYKNGKSASIPVTYYLNTDTDKDGNERQLVFIQADDYFDGTIYEANNKSEEPEKFAIMSKAVYELAKIKMDGITANKNTHVYSDDALDKIKEPDGMILNDWQASPVASLLRYKAPMENAHGQISDSTSKKLKDMKVITIGHNAMYQGSTQNNNNYYQKKATTSNILNTLFDKYSYDIVTHAKTGFSDLKPDDEGLKKLDNVLVMEQDDPIENYTNFLNMGITLSDYFDPVSQNYANELISEEHRDLSNMLQFSLVQKANAGRLIGIINGNDFNNLSIEAKKSQMENSTGVEFSTYNKSDSIEDIEAKRFENKKAMYNDFILPFTESKASSKDNIKEVKDISSRLEFVEGKQGTEMPVLTDEELANTPILLSGGRLVSQKGMGVLCEAMEKLYNNWDEEFPNQNKPILYIAGQDGEGGTQRKIIENFKDEKLSKEDNDRVLFAHGFAPMPAMMASSDFFLMPSIFEPCGLTQGESLAVATPVVASAVGGIVDTINRDGKSNGILTDKEKPLTSEGFYEALKEGLHVYFDDKEQYSKMVQDSIDEDFSWAKNGKQGPVYDYLELLGVNRQDLPDVK